MMPSRRACVVAGLPLLAGLALAPRAARAVEPWAAGRPAPPLELVDLDGNPRTLDAARGSVVLLNFWATWCEPCRAEMPGLLQLAEGLSDAGLRVWTVNYQERETKVRSFLETVLGEVPPALPVLLDRDGAAARSWTRRIFPTTVLVDRQGRPRASVVGEFAWGRPQAQALLAPLLQARR